MMRRLFFFIFAAARAALYGQALSSEVTVIESFEGSVIMSGNPRLGGSAVIVSASDEVKAADRDDFGNSGRFAKLNAAERGTTELIITQPVSVYENSILKFRYRTEIAREAAQSFKVYIDDVERASLDGVGAGWRVERVALNAGEHHIRFTAGNLKGAKVAQGYNAVYIDDIVVFPDKVAAIRMEPLGEQHTYLGAAGASKLRFTTQALLPDGTPKTGVKNITLSASGGEIDANGVWTPDETGNFTVTASLDSFSAQSGRLVVHEADVLKKPVLYSGTGKTYAGYTGGLRAKNAAEMPSRETLIITNPRAAAFDADAFFLLEGAVRNPAGRNYARVLVRRLDTNPPLETFYIVQGAFSRRIWLPFGAGDYRIELIEFDRVTITTPPKGEGTFRGGAFSREPLVFFARNTRVEPVVEGGQHWLYPSFNVQSDDFRVTNLLNHITFGIEDERKKIEAIHDYIVSHLVYDTASFANSSRARKMDALSTLENGTAVCEGYSWLSAALLRAAGVPVRLVANRGIVHLWNQVWVDGRWKLYDATWDDPVPDRGPDAVVRRSYFLLDSLSDSRHRGAGTVVAGDVE